MTKRERFLGRVARGPLVGDAAMGTAIYDHGIFINTCYDELCVTQPELVRDVHRRHVDAGAEIIETNSFGANRYRLARHGHEGRVDEFNIRAAELARSVMGADGLVAGSIGPLGIPLEPIGRTGLEEARAAFREQARALARGGVDLFMLETFASLDELLEGVRACREAAPDLAVVALATLDESGRTPLGTEAERIAEALQHEGVDVLGANCSTGPGPLLDALERMARVADGPFALFPNAGLPQVVEGRLLYLCSPEYLSKHVRKYVRTARMAIIGGCCGTTEQHVRLIRDAIRSVVPTRSLEAIPARSEQASVVELRASPLATRSPLGAALAEGRFVVSVEVDAPRGTSAEKALAAVRTLAAAGVDMINIADGPRAQARMSNTALALLIRRETDLPVIIHFCCRDRNLLSMQADLIGDHALGLRNILCVTGDPPRMGDYPQATAVFDVDAIGLVQLVSRLNRGLDAAGNPVGEHTDLVIGVAANPAAVNLEEEIHRFELKVEAGAEFCMTQPVYDVAQLSLFLDRTSHCRIPTLVGILPLASHRNAEFLHEEVPGMSVPLDVRERMRLAGSGDAARKEGVAIAIESLDACRDMVQGAYLMPPLGRVQSAIEILEFLHRER